MTSSKEQEQKERKALLGSSTDATSYRDLANLDNSLSGRFAIVPGAEPSVSGRKPFVEYPAAAPPWSGPQVGVEQPLGWSVEDQEPTGTFEEIQRSAASSVFPSLDATSAPPLELTRSDSTSGGEFSRVASPSSPNPGDASTGATGPSPGAILSSGDVDPAPAHYSQEVEALLDLMIVPKEK